MSQFSFLGTWDDSWRIVGSILERGDISLIPDLNYDDPKPAYISALNEEVKELLKRRPNLFLWSTQFSLFPPCMVRMAGGAAAGKYFLSLSRDGPGLELTLPGCYEADGVLNLACGTLSYQRLTFNSQTGRWEKPTLELQAGYKEITKTIKRHLVRHKFHKPIWTGRDALTLIERGTARVTGFGLAWPPGSG